MAGAGSMVGARPGPTIRRVSRDEVDTARLLLRRPVLDDVDDLHRICSDPRVWRHYPSLRHAERARTAASVERWMAGWAAHGLDTWTVRLAASSEIVGYGGCSVNGPVWNLGYRLAADAHGHGYATELATAAMRHARSLEPARPITAFLVEHNASSRRVVEKMGMELAQRVLDDGNPDPSAIRLIYADRVLTAAQLAAMVT